ncbi:HlyD family efflux transporter periplasmic adaptor subunit [Orenia marismortui]|uniref:Putative membrane fusion protein n=1 Tax=Orenia marismortui TaxID=46469 RepID=A0A4R8GLD5_9FIRM|nr:HlyD family efflux transporter periplasmic adaptor subunit [Orenia marismortui]TDX46476.1 putative membrane fusion protein [Orenia marismortui]
MRDFGRITSKVDHKKVKRNNLSGFIKFLLTIIISGLLIIFIINFLGYHSSKIVMTSYETIKDHIKTSGLLIRKERVTFAPKRGKIKLYQNEGERISTGNHIATIRNINEEDNLYNYYAGIVSYKIDGLEMTLREENIDKLNYDSFINLKGKINPINSGDNVNLGRPIFKIIDNFTFYLAVLLPQNQLSNYEVGTTIEVLFSQLKGVYFKGKIRSIIPDKPQNIMVIKFNKFIPELVDLRKVNVEIIRKRYHGIVVPSSSLVKRGDKVGVMVNGYTKKYFKEIKVLGEVEGKAVIKGIGPGVKVILN